MKNILFTRASLLGSLSTVALFGGTAVSAQTAPGVAEQEGFADIVVMANKRAETLQEAAGSISALSSDQLMSRAVTNISDIARQAPGVNIATNSGSTRVTIRGVGLQVANGTAEANVAQHVDGIFQSQPTMAQVAQVDLERVEVLRGPQGTLYGRNATGGTINFITKKPTPDLRFGLSAGFGSFKGRRVDGYVYGPVAGDILQARVSGYFNREAGYYRNTFLNTRINDSRNYGFRGALRFLPSDLVTVDLSAYYQRETGHYPVQTLIRGTNPLVAALALPAEIDIRRNRTASDLDPYLAKWTWGTTLDVQVEASDWLQIRSLTGLTRHRFGPSYFDGDGTSARIVTIGRPSDPRNQRANAISQEINFSGATMDDRFKYLVGLYYFNGELDASIPAYFNPDNDAAIGTALGGLRELQQMLREETTSHAVFADVTYSLTPTVRLNLGGRYSADEKESTQTKITTLLPATNVPLTIVNCSDLATQLDFKQFTGKVRFEWDVAPDILTYAQYQTGFKDGGVNLSQCANSPLGKPYDPEKLTSYEVGFKSSWVGGKLIFNASAFHYQYKGLQYQSFAGPGLSSVINIPKSRSTGGEIEVLARPLRGLDLNATASILHTEIVEMTSFDPATPALGVQDLSGFPLPNAPKLTFNIGAQYRVSMPFGSVTPRIEAYHSSSYNFRLFDRPEDRQKQFTILNAFVTADIGTNYQVRGYVKNITDKGVLNQLLFSGSSGLAGDYNRPREWGVDFAVRF